MKKSTLFLMLVVMVNCLFAQQRITFDEAPISADQSSILNQKLESFEVFEFDVKELNAYLKKNPRGANLTLDVSREISWQITVYENEIRGAGYNAILTTESGEVIDSTVDLDICNTYGGYIDDDPDQFIRLYVDDMMLKGFFLDKKRGHFVIDKLSIFTGNTEKDINKYVFYQPDKIIGKGDDGICGTEGIKEIIEFKENQFAPLAITTCRIMEVATDADFEWFQTHGLNSNAEILAIMNIVDGIYDNTFDLRILVVFQNVFITNNDPYVSFNSNDVILELRNFWNTNRTNVNRDLAHLFTGKELFGGVLGQADGLGMVCANPARSYSFTVRDIFEAYTTTHEIGHNLNATHPNPLGIECNPIRTVMCQGANIPNIAFSFNSQTQINNFLNANQACLLNYQNLNIAGTNLLCSPTAYNYSVNPPPGQNVTWATSPNINLNTTVGPAVTATPNAGNGPGWIEASFNVGCPVTERRNVWVNRPTFTNHTVDGSPFYIGSCHGVCPGFHVARLTLHGAVPDQMFWTLNPGGAVSWVWEPYNSQIVFETLPFYTQYPFSFVGTVSNTCGQSQFTFCFISGPNCQFLFGPNPADDELTLTRNYTEEVDEPDEVEIILYNNSNQKVYSVTSKEHVIKIPVRGFPEGNYILHIVNGEAIMREQIQIRH